MRNTSIILRQCVKGFKAVKRVALLLLLFIIIAFSGCCEKELFNRGVVYKDWTKTLSELGIFPVFPPREDVQVGDVWLLPMHPFETNAIEEIGGLGLTGIWCDNILTPGNGTATINTVANFYEARPSFPSTTAACASIIYAMQTGSATAFSGNVKREEDRIAAVPRGTDTVNIFTKSSDICRLRQVAFPEFAFTKIDKDALGALVPVEYFLNVAGGFTYSKIEKVSLKISSAESYGCPVAILLQKFLENDSIKWDENSSTSTLWLKAWNPIGNPGNCIPGVRGLDKRTALLARSQFNEALSELFKNGCFSDELKECFREEMKEDRNYLWIALINEVYYARAMDISISTAKGYGGGVNVSPITNKMLEELSRLKDIKSTKTIPKNPNKDAGINTANGTATSTVNMADTGGRPMVETTTTEQTDDAFSLAMKINEYNKKLGEQLVPGGSVSVVAASDSYVGLRRIFDRPIAVGVRGVIMRIDVKNSNDESLKIDLCDDISATVKQE